MSTRMCAWPACLPALPACPAMALLFSPAACLTTGCTSRQQAAARCGRCCGTPWPEPTRSSGGWVNTVHGNAATCRVGGAAAAPQQRSCCGRCWSGPTPSSFGWLCVHGRHQLWCGWGQLQLARLLQTTCKLCFIKNNTSAAAAGHPGRGLPGAQVGVAVCMGMQHRSNT